MTARVIKVRFNSHLRGYTNKKCVKYSLYKIPNPAFEKRKIFNIMKF